MPKDDGLVADVQSRASGALYNWNRPFNDQSVAYYRARHREDIELNRARGTDCPQIFATSATTVGWSKKRVHKLDLRKATIAQLAQLYPACFYAARHERRPLKIGIGRDLAALDLGIGRRELVSALAWYVNGIDYLQALRVGADRIGLDGAPSGVVSQADEAHAREKLAALGTRRVNVQVEQKLRPKLVTVAPSDRPPSPRHAAQARSPAGDQVRVTASPRKPEAAAPNRLGLAGLRAAASARKAVAGNATNKSGS
jgi:ProP effector